MSIVRAILGATSNVSIREYQVRICKNSFTRYRWLSSLCDRRLSDFRGRVFSLSLFHSLTHSYFFLFPFSLFNFANSSRRTRDEKGALAFARVPRPENSPLACRAEPRAIRVFMRLEAAFPTDALTAPTSAIMQTVLDSATLFVPHSALFVPLLVARGRWYSFLVALPVSPLPSLRANNSPTFGYSVLRPCSPWPVGGQANVHESSSVAAHMHATASDRCTTSRRRRSRSRSYRRRSASRKLSSKCVFDHAEREGRVDRLT